MKLYAKEEIEGFLLAIDENLNRPFELIIIGGTAAALGYRVTRFTKDIDTVNRTDGIQAAYELAKLKTGLNIPLGPARIEDGPYNYGLRLIEHLIEGLKKLRIRIPERHDLVLMKTVRGYQHDIETAREIHNQYPLSDQTLIQLMKTEMTQVTGDPSRLLENFYALIEAVFGEEKIKKAQNELRGWAKKR